MWRLGMLAMVMACGALPTQAQVGFQVHEFVDEDRGRALTVRFWYPTASEATTEIAGNRVFEGVRVAPDAKPGVSQAPLVFLVHGTMGNWRTLSWLAVELAEQGAVVAATNHPGSTTGDATPETVLRAWHQPEDIRFLIDAVTASEPGRFVDQERIAVVGLSLGGSTALALAGARLDIERFPAFCREHDDDACDYFRSAFPSIDKAFVEQANRSHRDERVGAVVALAPGFVESMTLESMRAVSIPVLVVGADSDANVPPATHFHPVLRHLSATTEYLEVEGAHHFSFMQRCRPGGAKLLEEDGEAIVCLEPGQRRRAAIHDEVVTAVVGFLAPLLDSPVP
jgi:predicted dienelactone hydrolase